MSFQVNVVSDGPTFATVTVGQTGTFGGMSPTGFAAVLNYLNTYFADAVIPASNTDARLPSVQVTTSGVVVNVLPGDAATVQAELVSLLTTPANLA
jgi:hypothetical protein